MLASAIVFVGFFFFFNLYEMEQQDMGPGEDQMA